MSIGSALDPKTAPTFPMAARAVLGDAQLRKNVRHATGVIQAKRAKVVDEMPDWQQLREAGRALRAPTIAPQGGLHEHLARESTAGRVPRAVRA